MHFRKFAFLLLVISSCSRISSPSAAPSFQKDSKHHLIAIKDVNVITAVDGDSVMRNVNVIIRNKTITAIGGNIPNGAEVINGTNKWLIPGLIDMHVHIPADIHIGPKLPSQGASIFFNTQDNMTPFIAKGITTVLELNARPEHFGQRNEIERGNVIGPRIALAALITGGEGMGLRANNESEGRQAVRDAKGEGYEFIKVYSGLNIETFNGIVDEAAKQGMKVIGHIPNAFAGNLKNAFVPHFGMVAHAEEFSKHTSTFNDEDARQFAQMMLDNGTWLSPTLIAMEKILSQSRSLEELRASTELKYIHPLLQSKWLTANSYNRNSSPERIVHFQKMVDFHIRLVKACKSAGVPMVAGTDAGISGVVPGFSLLDELELLGKAGLSPIEVIAAATRLPAQWLGIDSIAGTIEAGKDADLVLLDASPLHDIKNVRRLSGVLIKGRWLDRSDIDAMLTDLADHNSAAKGDFDWNKTIGK